MISSYEVIDNKIRIKTPYCDAVVEQCRKWAGKYENGAWVVPISRLADVWVQLGNSQEQVEIEVGYEDWIGGSQIRVGWFILAGRRSRDARADVYADLVEGEIPTYGGSMKHPLVNASKDAKFRLWVPIDFAKNNKLKIVSSVDSKISKTEKINKVKSLMLELGVTMEDLTL